MEDSYHYFLPKSKKYGYFNGQKFKQSMIWTKWFSQCVVKEYKIVEGVAG